MYVNGYGKCLNGRNYDCEQPQKDKKPSKAAIIGGFMAGSTVYGVVNAAIRNPISNTCMSKIKDMGKNMTDAEFSAIKDATQKLIKTTGLDKKGVSILAASPENATILESLLKKEFNENLVTRFMPKTIKEMITQNADSMFKSGQNAAYLFKGKKLIMPTGKGLSWAVFHEAGHAMNANFSTVGKILQKSRSLAILAVPILLIALLKNKKPDGVKPEGAVDKTTTFIKDNAGKLTFATFLPTLIEEGMASFKGNKFAKELLNPALAKKVARGNKIAYLTYLGTAVAAGTAVYIGKKVRDAIVHGKKAA